jgi:hypothetical protein
MGKEKKGGREGVRKRTETEHFVEAFNIPVCMQDMVFLPPDLSKK